MIVRSDTSPLANVNQPLGVDVSDKAISSTISHVPQDIFVEVLSFAGPLNALKLQSSSPGMRDAVRGLTPVELHTIGTDDVKLD